MHSDADGWSAEAAIPLSELTGEAVGPGRVWACNVVRVVPGNAAVPNPEGLLKPEMYMDAKIIAGLGTKLAVPEEAVLNTGERQIVFVVEEQGKYQPRQVRLGQEAEARQILGLLEEKLKEGKPFEVPVAVVHLGLREYDRAIDEYKKATALDSKFTAAYVRLAALYQMKNQLAEAESMNRQVMSLEPESAFGYNQVAYMLAEKGEKLDEALLLKAQQGAKREREAILRHKLVSLTSECIEYLTVSLVAAETADSEKAELRSKILGQKESIEDTRTALKLIVRHAAGGTRSIFEDFLRKDELPIKQHLRAGFENEFPSWTRSLAAATVAFDDWLRARMTKQISELSKKHLVEFIEPVRRVSRQLSQSLQDFRNRLSERTLNALGVPLRTTEMDLLNEEPRSPDVRVGKIFDRNWELLSSIIPMPLIRRTLKRHFRRKIDDVVFTNLSRLASQWEEIVNTALFALQAESMRRLDNLISTIEKLLDTAGQEAPHIRHDLEKLEGAAEATEVKAPVNCSGAL